MTRLYKCNDCGRIAEREEMSWTDLIYDQKDLRGFVHPICPACGSDDIDYGESCEYCQADIGEEWLGNFLVCEKCNRILMASVEEAVQDYAAKNQTDYSTAKEWFLGWAENNF